MEEIVRGRVTIGADIVLRFGIFGGEGFEWKEVVNMFDHPHLTKGVASSFFASNSPAAVVEHDAVLGFPTSHETPFLGSSQSMAAPPDAEALYDLKIE
jgi:hypothetical protein